MHFFAIVHSDSSQISWLFFYFYYLEKKNRKFLARTTPFVTPAAEKIWLFENSGEISYSTLLCSSISKNDTNLYYSSTCMKKIFREKCAVCPKVKNFWVTHDTDLIIKVNPYLQYCTYSIKGQFSLPVCHETRTTKTTSWRVISLNSPYDAHQTFF